jgi:outer membrane lipoprotein-sorting protein
MGRRAAQAGFLLIWLGYALSVCAQQTSPSPPLTADEVVARMVKAYADVRANFRAYETKRHYSVFHGDSGEPRSDIQVNISFLPPGEKSFRIERSSGGMAEHVVRKALEKEVELTKDPQVTAMSPENYDFELEGQGATAGHDCYILAMTPKRDSKDLLNGRIWVDAHEFLIRRVEGKPAKSPSWWVKDLELVILYDNVKGLWLQTATEANAHVRMAGEYKVVSRESDVRTATYVSEEFAPNRVLFRPVVHHTLNVRKSAQR